MPVVHYWADLQSVDGFRCYDNTHVCRPKLIALYTANANSAERKMSASGVCTSNTAVRPVPLYYFIDIGLGELAATLRGSWPGVQSA